MNALIRFAEKKLAIIGLLVLTDVLACRSMFLLSEGLAKPGDSGASPFSKILTPILWLAYLMSVFLVFARWKSIVRPARRNIFLWLLLGMALISFLWSDLPSLSLFSGIFTLLSTLFGLYLASRYSVREQLEIVAWAFGIAAVFSFFYTLAFPGYGIEQGYHAGAWRGAIAHKNPQARLMAISALALLLAALNSRKYRFVVWAAFGIAATLVLLTNSKTGLLIFLTVMFLVPLYGALRWSDSVLVPFLITAVLIVGSGATWLVTNWEPFLYGLGKDPTLSGRTVLWEIAIEKILQRPWLGYGFQAFWQDDGEAYYLRHQLHYEAIHAHNGFINQSLDLGLIGLSLFLLSLLIAYKRSIAWARFGKTAADLWPVVLLTFVFMYNQSESTIIEPNSIFWTLQVAVSFSLPRNPMSQRKVLTKAEINNQSAQLT